MSLLGSFKEEVKNAEATTVSEGFKPLQSGIYPATLTKFGIYTNNFSSQSVFIEVEVKIDGEDKPRVLSVDRGLTLKDKSINKGTMSLINNIFEITGVDIDTAEPVDDTIKTWGKEYTMEVYKDCYNHSISAFIRETFEEGAKYDKGNILEGIFDADGKNGAGEDQTETFMKKIEEKPVLVKTTKAKAATTGGAGKAGTAAGTSRRL